VLVMSAMKHKSEGGKVKRVQVSFTEEQWRLIERLKGVMGNDDAELVRNLVLAWLSEKSIVSEVAKKELKARGDRG